MTHRILVLGGSGPTGRLVVAQALAQGNAVTAFSRHPEKLELTDPGLTKTAGDSEDGGAVARVLPGHDVVICALGRGLSLRSRHLMERSVACVIPAMQRLGPKRLIYLSAFGVAESIRFAPWYMKLQFRTMLASIYADKERAEAVVRGSGLEWTIVSPVILTSKAAVERYVAAEEIAVMGMPMISRGSVAEYMLKCVNDRGTAGKTMIVAPDTRSR